MKIRAITFIGRNSKDGGFSARVGRKTYEFEWQKSLAVGRQRDEVDPKHAAILSKWKDRSGKRMFVIE